jgi:hypothetical protein
MEKASSDQTEIERDESEKRKPRRERKEEPERAEEKVESSSKPRRRRAENGGDTGGGWMSMDTSKQISKAEKLVSSEEDAAFAAQNKDKHFEDDNEEIMIIPDLDEEGGADADHRIAHAPKSVTRRIPTLSELENEAHSAAPLSALAGVDLAPLISAVVPPSTITETDNPWTFDSLLTEVSDELTGPPPSPKKTVLANPSPSKGMKNTLSKNKSSALKT